MPAASRARKTIIAVSTLIQRETNILDTKGRAFGNNQIMTDIPKSFVFIDDPEGVEKCRRENPDAFIMHLIIVDPPLRA